MVRLHDQCAPARRLLHRASPDAAQGVDRARGLRALRAAVRRARRVLQPGVRRVVLRAGRAVRQHGRPSLSLAHQGDLCRRAVAGRARDHQRHGSRDRLPVRRAGVRPGRAADRAHGAGGLGRMGPVLDFLADYLALIMFVAMFFVIFCGYPVAFIMGGMALLFALAGWALGVFNLIGLYDVVLRMGGGVAADPVLASIPMFIFMGAVLERSGSAMDMLKATEVLLKRVPGALAVAVMVMGTILAAPIGVVGAAVVTLSVIALPQMLSSGYDKRLAIGTIASAGTLGILIPPAIMLVVMAEMLATSAGARFLAAVMPGFLLSGLYLIYIIVVAIFRPGAAPKLPPDYGPQTRGEFWTAVWRGLFPMTALMVIVKIGRAHV